LQCLADKKKGMCSLVNGEMFKKWCQNMCHTLLLFYGFRKTIWPNNTSCAHNESHMKFTSHNDSPWTKSGYFENQYIFFSGSLYPACLNPASHVNIMNLVSLNESGFTLSSLLPLKVPVLEVHSCCMDWIVHFVKHIY